MSPVTWKLQFVRRAGSMNDLKNRLSKSRGAFVAIKRI